MAPIGAIFLALQPEAAKSIHSQAGHSAFPVRVTPRGVPHRLTPSLQQTTDKLSTTGRQSLSGQGFCSGMGNDISAVGTDHHHPYLLISSIAGGAGNHTTLTCLQALLRNGDGRDRGNLYWSGFAAPKILGGNSLCQRSKSPLSIRREARTDIPRYQYR